MSASPWPQVTRNIWAILCHYGLDPDDARALAELITVQVRADLAAYRDMRAFAAKILQDLDALPVTAGHEGCRGMPVYDEARGEFACGDVTCTRPVDGITDGLRPVTP